MKKWIALVAVLAAGAWYFLAPKEQPTEYTYRTVEVTRGDIVSSVTATGILDAVTIVDVGTQVSGTIKEIYADYNQQVKKGEVIALIDPDVLSARVRESQASLASGQASVAKAKAAANESYRTYQRYKQLWDRDLIARADLDAAEATYLSNRASVDQAQASVQQLQAALEQARTNLGYTKIVSPEDGVIIAREVNVGQTVAASLSTPTLFSIAKDLSDMQIAASVDEADISRVKVGQEVRFTVDAYDNRSFTGTVRQVRLATTTTDNVVTYPVIIAVANPDLALMLGMTANVSIITNHETDVLKVPLAALRFTPPEAGGQTAASAGGSSPFAPPVRPRQQKTAQETGNGNLAGTTATVWTVENGQLGEKVTFRSSLSDGTSVAAKGAPQLKEGTLLAVSYSEKPKESLWKRILP